MEISKNISSQELEWLAIKLHSFGVDFASCIRGVRELYAETFYLAENIQCRDYYLGDTKLMRAYIIKKDSAQLIINAKSDIY